MDYKSSLQQIQVFLENNPLIILGSGASAGYGMPLMSELSKGTKRHSDKFNPTDFNSLCKNLDSMGLEEALDKMGCSDEVCSVIQRWERKCVGGVQSH